MADRINVPKTHKLFIGGAFPRSESGRTMVANAHDGTFVANVAMASRKDLRDAVTAARTAFPGWSGRTAYNRGQILYRVAEILEDRRDQLARQVGDAEGLDAPAARQAVAAAVDRWVWYAGWTDKITQVFGNANPVAGPYFNVTTPEPTGIVGVLAPQASSLLGLVSVLAPSLAVGNTVVVVASESRPVPAVTLGEVLATSDVPGGVVNVLTGRTAELAPVLASHVDVGALDLTGAGSDQAADLARAAADSTTRIVADPSESTAPGFTWHDQPTSSRLRGAMEVKTVWHPAGT